MTLTYRIVVITQSGGEGDTSLRGRLETEIEIIGRVVRKKVLASYQVPVEHPVTLSVEFRGIVELGESTNT